MRRFQSRHLFQLREIGLGLTFIGGFIDAYTFMQRGGVLAAGQTGNLIFLSVDVARRDLPGVVTKLVTVIFFIIGVTLVGLLEHRLGARSHYWRLPILIAELVVCLMVGMLPATVSNAMVVPPLAFVMAMQTTAFRQSLVTAIITCSLPESQKGNDCADKLLVDRRAYGIGHWPRILGISVELCCGGHCFRHPATVVDVTDDLGRSGVGDFSRWLLYLAISAARHQ